MKKIANITIIIAIIVTVNLQIGQKVAAEDQSNSILYHCVFKMDKDSVPDYAKDYEKHNRALFDVLRRKMDILGFKYCIIELAEPDNFVIAFDTSDDPNSIIAKMETDKLPIPLTFITYFKCGLPCLISKVYCNDDKKQEALGK